MRSLLHSRTALIVVIVLTLFIYSRFSHPSRSLAQQDFDKWLESRKQTLLYSSPGTMAILPKLALEIQKESENKVLVLDSVPTEEQRERITRLLELMSSSNIFSSATPEGSTYLVAISVEDGDKKFITKVSEASLQQNVSAQIMLKLFEEYAASASAKPEGGVVFDTKA